jgi:hypothetical protein
MPAYLGTEDAWPDPPAVKEWRTKVKAEGRVAVRMPTGQYKNELASRAMIGGDYKLAPFAARSADRLQRLKMGLTIGAIAVENAAENTAQSVLKLPQTVAQQAFGISPKVFPWLVGGLAAAYIANATGVLKR